METLCQYGVTVSVRRKRPNHGSVCKLWAQLQAHEWQETLPLWSRTSARHERDGVRFKLEPRWRRCSYSARPTWEPDSTFEGFSERELPPPLHSFLPLLPRVCRSCFSIHLLTSVTPSLLPHWSSWGKLEWQPPSARVQRSARREDDNTASSVSRVNICCCVQDSLSVALLQPQSTPTPALATRIISSGRKSFPLVSYYWFLHRLMMSQSIHKFVVVCRFEKFDMAAGCTGMKVLSGQTAKTWQQGRGDISQREEAN